MGTDGVSLLLKSPDRTPPESRSVPAETSRLT